MLTCPDHIPEVIGALRAVVWRDGGVWGVRQVAEQRNSSSVVSAFRHQRREGTLSILQLAHHRLRRRKTTKQRHQTKAPEVKLCDLFAVSSLCEYSRWSTSRWRTACSEPSSCKLNSSCSTPTACWRTAASSSQSCRTDWTHKHRHNDVS